MYNSWCKFPMQVLEHKPFQFMQNKNKLLDSGQPLTYVSSISFCTLPHYSDRYQGVYTILMKGMRDYLDILKLNDLQHKMQESNHLISIFQKMLSVELTEINFWRFASNQMTANHHKSFQSSGYFQYGKCDFKILWSEKAALAVSNCLLILIYSQQGIS